MKYICVAKKIVIMAFLILGLAACETPGPESQTPMNDTDTEQNIKDQDSDYQAEQHYLRTVLFFDSGKIDISPHQKKILQQLATYLKQNPGATIRVEGHADARGSSNLNHRLASQRADAAVRFLKIQSISTKRIETVLFDAKSPKKLGKDSQAYSRNRRVELVILPEGKRPKS